MRTNVAGDVGAGSGLVLLYHRVAAAQLDPQLLAVSPERFAEHMQILRQTAVPMRLPDMVKAAARGTIPRRAVAVTFDDGYGDNFRHAKPILAAEDVPATVFVTAGYVGARREFWWDGLERIFLRPGRLPKSLVLKPGGRERRWELNGGSLYGREEYERRLGWNVLLSDDFGVRQRMYLELCDLLRPMTEEAREGTMSELSAWSGVPREPRAAVRPMNADEVARMADGGLVEVGAHTMTHSMLSGLAEEEQRSELTASKSRLEDILGRRVASFSYPYGTRKDYTSATAQMAREAGFELACSNFRGLVRAGTGPFELPRYIVRDWDGDTFAQRLEEEFARG